MNKKLVLFLIVLISLSIWQIGFAGISKEGSDEYCLLCHTQEGISDGTTKYTCIECHSNEGPETIKVLSETYNIKVPVVYNYNVNAEDLATLEENLLAGGNFYWVTNGCNGCGHNVTAIPGVSQDPNFSQTPGFVSGKTCSSCSCHGSGNMVLTKCIFCHNPKHHADDSGPVVGDDEEVKYRFLSLDYYHPSTFQEGSYNFYGVAGIEDDDWEYTGSSDDHNEYCGAVSSGDYSSDSHSISRYCAACHYGFYGDNTEHWKRHPSDYALPNSGEYANYTTYNPLAPIARLESTLTSMTVASSIVTPGQDQVSCLSCHRPHGSPYKHMLRWDPNNATASCCTCHSDKMPEGTSYHHVADCNVCHTHHGGTTNLRLIKEVIETPNSGEKEVMFTSTTGQNSYADGDSVYDGICEVCHTQTRHHRNDGSDGTEHYDGQNCISCHSHANQFSFILPYEQSHNTHLNSDIGPKLSECTECHDANDFSLFADGEPFESTGVCDVCHSPDGSYDGVNDAVIGAKPNWEEGVYDEDGNLKVGKEDWCAGCHDDGTSVIKDVNAPNVMGDNIGYGYNISGHGRYEIGCSDCHDLGITHIDGEARTYSATADNYREGYRLKEDMAVPRDGEVYPQAFKLCTSCHEYGEIIGDESCFRDDEKGEQFHQMHLEWWPAYICSDSDFDGNEDSAITCIICHNVHGSPTPAMIRHGELISTPGTSDKVPALDFKWYKSDGKTETDSYVKSCYGSLVCGGFSELGVNHVCVGCHPSGELVYHRKEIDVEKVWTTDLNDNPKSSFSPGEKIRYHVRFRIYTTAPCYVKAIGKAFNLTGNDWLTKFRKKRTLSAGTYHWKWDRTVPADASSGSEAKVKVILKMYNETGERLLSKDKKGKKFSIE